MRVELVDSMGNDLTVANAARASFNKQKELFEASDEKLIKYLATHKHWTPFAHVQISLRVEMPIFIARQYFKHIVGSVKNEVSRRYVDDAPEFWYPESWRARPEKSIKQGSGEALGNQMLCHDFYNQAIRQCEVTYNTLLQLGVCPEQARAILPQSMLTTVVDCGSLEYWARMYRQRSDPHAQKEWQPIVERLDEIIGNIVPISWKALKGDKQ